jgi:hypothetical protein
MLISKFMLLLSEEKADKHEETFGNRENGKKNTFFLFSTSLQKVNQAK